MTERLHFHFSLSCIGEGNGNPLQCSCLENPRDGGAWWAAVYGVAQSRTWLKWLSSSTQLPQLFLLHLKKLFIFNWRIIALQYRVGFCHTSAWISHRYTCPLPLEPPSHLPLYPIPPGCYRAQFESPESCSKFPFILPIFNHQRHECVWQRIQGPVQHELTPRLT